ncbi:MAG: winged helix-turn-helix domain-containing protein [Devosia sp.]
MEKLAFGGFVFDVGMGLLFEGGEPVAIGSRGIRLLALLLRRCGEVLTKDELIEAAWPDCTVEEANLSVQVSQLRRRLGAAPGGGEWIATVPRVGYRFARPVETRPRSGAPSQAPRVAILPFADLGSRADAGGAASVSEDLTVALSKLSVVTVICRKPNASDGVEPADIREVAARLGASYVLDGSVRRAGQRTRTTAHLIDGASGTRLWSEHFDGDADSDQADPADLAGTIAAVVEPQIQTAEIARSRRERPQSMAAYDLYLRALHLMRESRPDAHAAARVLVNEALRLEPENVSFLAAAAEILHHAISVGWPTVGPGDVEECSELAYRGVRLAGNDSVALSLFGSAILTVRQFDLGRDIIRRAVDAGTKSSMVNVAAGLSALWEGKLDEAERYYTLALQGGRADPTLKFALGGIAAVHRRRENFEESLRWARLAFAVNPNYAGTNWTLIASSAVLGRKDDARRYLEHYQRVAPGVTVASIAAGQPIEDPALLTVLLSGLRLGGLPEGVPASQG